MPILRHPFSCGLNFTHLGLALFFALSSANLARGADKAVKLLPPSADEVQLIYTGDIMLADGPGRAIERGVDPFADFVPHFKAADLVIGNLECVIATKGEAVDKPWTFRAHTRCIPLLTKYFHAVSLANNHTGDFGKEAFVEQLSLLEGKLPTFGGGKDLAAARVPVILERKGIRFALLGYNEFKPRSFEATATTAGVAWAVDEVVLEDIRLARTKYHADIVIPFMHWGHEYEPDPSDRQRKFAQQMIETGADLVIGAHPHVTQGVGQHQNKLIVYSLGNFVFDGFEEPEAKIGWLLRLNIGKKGLTKWDTIVARMDADGVPHVDSTTASPAGEISPAGK